MKVGDRVRGELHGEVHEGTVEAVRDGEYFWASVRWDDGCFSSEHRPLEVVPFVRPAFPVRTCKTCGHKTVSTSTWDFCTKCRDDDGLRPSIEEMRGGASTQLEGPDEEKNDG